MNKSLKTYTSLCGAVAAAFALTACGSDSGSDAGNSETYKATIDEQAQTITVTNPGEKMCVITEENVSWQNMKEGPETNLTKYQFVGDTLVLFNYDDEDLEYNNHGDMYVGGKAGNIYGTWTMIPCEYKASSQSTSCDDDYEDDGSSFQLTISSGSVRSQYTPSQNNKEVDYSKSYYRYELYNNLYSSLSYLPSLSELFYNMEMDESITTIPGITSTNLSAKGETITFGDVTVVVNVKSAERTDDGMEAAVDITINGKTCTNEAEKTYEMSSSLCKVGNMEYFDIEDGTDANGNKFYYVEGYSKDNSEEFQECIQSAIPKNTLTDDDDFDWSVLTKKAAASKHSRQKSIERWLKITK